MKSAASENVTFDSSLSMDWQKYESFSWSVLTQTNAEPLPALHFSKQVFRHPLVNAKKGIAAEGREDLDL